MKPRNREVNIFNLSMLDVISGALGALIIIMVVLFPHYTKQRTEEEYQQMEARVQQLQAQVQRLRMRRPFVIASRWMTKDQDVDLFLQDSTPQAPQFNPQRKYGSYHTGDIYTECSVGPCSETKLIRDSPDGIRYKIFLNLYDRKGNRESPWIYSFLLYGTDFIRLPAIRLDNAKQAYFLGTLTMGADDKLTFQGATPAIEQEWQRLEKERLSKKQN